MKYFCETVLSDRLHFFLSDAIPKSPKINSYAIDIDEIRLKDLDINISIFNSMLTSHNLIYIYMMLSELCIEDKEKKLFTARASEVAYRHLPVTS
ncbi:MAG: hypothetical protein ACM3KR_06980 [Deltaproteobacteria bacterium]